MSKKKSNQIPEKDLVSNQETVASGPTEVYAKRFRHEKPELVEDDFIDNLPEQAVNAKGEEI